jgi:cellulose synthase operon protein C
MPVKMVLAAGGLLLLAGSTLASDNAPPPAQEVDLSALRYYALRNETARVDAEIRRLRSLYPGWQPPADPSALPDEGAQPSEDQVLWDLFSADKLAELKQAMAERRAADASWTPPAELEGKLAMKEQRFALLDASLRHDDAAVTAIADKLPALVTPADLDVAWRVAEARARIGETGRSLELDKAILSATADPAARLATVQKAMAVLTPEEMRDLLTLGKAGPDGKSEFEGVETDLARRKIGHILSDGATDDASPADIERVAAAARLPNASGDDAALLGWLAARRKDYPGSLGWFQLAMAPSPDPSKAGPTARKAAQGAATALKELGRISEAEDLAYRWRDADPALTLFYLSLVEPELTRPVPQSLPQERLKRFSEVAIAQQSGSSAQALGWYAYNVGQFPAARAWFEKAMTWQPRESTALGLALSMQRLEDETGLKAFIEQNLPTYPTLASVVAPPATASRAPQDSRVAVSAGGGGGGGGTMAAAYRSKKYAACVATADRLAASGRLDARSALQKGWCLMALNRPQEAAIAFAQGRGAGGTAPDAAYGEALARLRSGQAAEAAMAASSAPLTAARRNEIGVAILAEQAASHFAAERYRSTLETLNQRRQYTPEPRDLSVLRAWSLYHLGYQEEARKIFALLDQQLSTKDTRAGLAVTAAPRH